MTNQTITPNGSIRYFTAGEYHREDAPAIIKSDGTEEYWQHGVLHRIDGPTIITDDTDSDFFNTVGYYHFGRLHRVDAPALIYSNGENHWYKHNVEHCLTGPAKEFPDGTKEYWVEGSSLSEKDLKRKIEIMESPFNSLNFWFETPSASKQLLIQACTSRKIRLE